MVTRSSKRLYFKKSLKGGPKPVQKKAVKAPEENKDRRPRHYEPQRPKSAKRLRPTRYFSEHKHKLRKSITPGTILILLLGPHKGKRVVFLKQLPKTGLLLVTGPFKLNGCPLRRVDQRGVIATSKKINLSFEVPETYNDEFFKRAEKKSAPKSADKDLFAQEKEEYKLTEERKKAQKEIDSQIIKSIKAEKDPFLLGYLSTKFCLYSKDFPHRMKF